MAERRTDEDYMRLALEQAVLAAGEGEVPVGAVLVSAGGEILAMEHNRCEAEKLPTAHAEMLAVAAACRALGDWRLTGCTLYVTLEPCPMCMGALIHARVSRVVYGAPDARAGACGSLLCLQEYPLECRPQVTRDLLRTECLELLRRFFVGRRGGRQGERARTEQGTMSPQPGSAPPAASESD